ncbi:hypothetical protein F8M49_21520 [Rhodococcus zopfii]|uniref:Uncharacterized protein n=1 Tax=Rhodococcus zopfii TaxID=43772 RepID=A0ABU3WU97_9NOCA|nr:hypothetical protein [Rhodococcus zopfii]
MNRMLETLDVLNGPMYVMTGEAEILRRPGSRTAREILLVTTAAVATIATVLVMVTGCVMLMVAPWSTPEPPLLVTIAMTVPPAITSVITYAAAAASRHARDPHDVLTDDEIKTMPLILAQPWLDAREAASAIRTADGHDAERESMVAETLWLMAEHVKTGTGLHARFPDTPFERLQQLRAGLAAKMRVHADRLADLAAEAIDSAAPQPLR